MPRLVPNLQLLALDLMQKAGQNPLMATSPGLAVAAQVAGEIRRLASRRSDS